MKRQMICISGNIAVGKTEVATKLSSRLGFKLYKASESFRAKAREKNMDLVEFNEYVKNNPEIDMTIEEKTKEITKDAKDMVVDARLGFFLCQDSFKVYMVSDIDTAAQRLFVAAVSRGKEEQYGSLNEAKKAIIKRENAEKDRYFKLYDVDIHDEDNYDYIIDTTNLSSDEVVEKIIKAYNVWINVDFNEG